MNQFRTKSARRPLPKISRAGANVFAELAKKTKFTEPALSEHWPTIAGAEIAALCRPGRITGHGSGRTLEVVAPSGAAAAQMQYHADNLKIRVNKYLGPNAVARIFVRQRASSLPPAREIKGGDRSPLDAALAAFSRSIGKKPDNS